MSKVALFAFTGEEMCFVHVMLYAVELHSRGYEVRVILEGSATKLISKLAFPDQPFSGLYAKLRGLGLIDGICKACSTKMGTLDEAIGQGLTLLDDLSGHPSLARYLEAGYQIYTF